MKYSTLAIPLILLNLILGTLFIFQWSANQAKLREQILLDVQTNYANDAALEYTLESSTRISQVLSEANGVSYNTFDADPTKAVEMYERVLLANWGIPYSDAAVQDFEAENLGMCALLVSDGLYLYNLQTMDAYYYKGDEQLHYFTPGTVVTNSLYEDKGQAQIFTYTPKLPITWEYQDTPGIINIGGGRQVKDTYNVTNNSLVISDSLSDRDKLLNSLRIRELINHAIDQKVQVAQNKSQRLVHLANIAYDSNEFNSMTFISYTLKRYSDNSFLQSVGISGNKLAPSERYFIYKYPNSEKVYYNYQRYIDIVNQISNSNYGSDAIMVYKDLVYKQLKSYRESLNASFDLEVTRLYYE